MFTFDSPEPICNIYDDKWELMLRILRRVSPELSRRALNAIICIPTIKRQRLFWHRHTEEKAKWRWRWRLEWCSHQLSNAEETRQPSKASICKKWIALTACRGITAPLAHWFHTWALQTVRQYICVILGHQVCGNLLWKPKLKQHS